MCQTPLSRSSVGASIPSIHPSLSPSLTDSQDLPNQRRPMHQLLHESLLHRYYNYCRTAQHVMTHGDSMSYGGQREEDPK
jgi:hypothetical protein